MTSPFEMQMLWSALDQRGRALLNRLAAAAANAELLEESASRAGCPSEVCAGLEALRGDLTEAARHTRALVEALGAQLSTTSRADLHTALRDTLAPLRRHLSRREMTVVEPAIPESTEIALEPELLRAAIAASLGLLLASALPMETIRLECTTRTSHESLSFALETRASVPDLGPDGELASLAAWLEGRGGALVVKKARGRVVVTLDLPKSRGTTEC